MPVDSREVDAVKQALTADPGDIGVGVIHLPTAGIILRPFNSIPSGNGHIGLVDETVSPADEFRGFIVIREAGRYDVLNSSHLNGPQGAPGSLRMPAQVFDMIVREL